MMSQSDLIELMNVFVLNRKTSKRIHYNILPPNSVKRFW